MVSLCEPQKLLDLGWTREEGVLKKTFKLWKLACKQNIIALVHPPYITRCPWHLVLLCHFFCATSQKKKKKLHFFILSSNPPPWERAFHHRNRTQKSYFCSPPPPPWGGMKKKSFAFETSCFLYGPAEWLSYWCSQGRFFCLDLFWAKCRTMHIYRILCTN